jgi:hypothetical protein
MSKCFLPRCFRRDERLSDASRLVILKLARPKGFESLTFAFGGCGLPARGRQSWKIADWGLPEACLSSGVA